MKLHNGFALLVLALALSVPAHAAKVRVNGAGATFPYPLYSKWFSDFQKVDPEAQINYQSVGSGAGINQILEGTVDFGASDAPMTDAQLNKADPAIVHIPTVVGAVVLTYNIPGVPSGLKLTADVVVDLFLGKITKWSDPRIASVNPGVKLPDMPVMIIHRADGSGTTAIFTDYLTKASPEWKQKGTALKWPTGLGAKGNEGVTGMVKQSPGSIGYVELIYAENNKLPYAALKNRAGKFVLPTMGAVSAAAAGSLKTMPVDFRVSLTDAPGAEAYPISGFTYLLIPSVLPKEKGDKIVKFLRWAVQDGQRVASTLFYAPLPKDLVKKVEARIQTLQLK